MAERKRIGLRELRALGLGETVWDSTLPGFGARRQNGEAVTYLLKYRTIEGRQRWLTIGRHTDFTPDQARKIASELRGDVAKGLDPAADKQAKRNAATMSELCDLYMTEAKAGRVLTRLRVPKKDSTLLSDRGRVDGHIKPLLGRLAVAAVTSQDVDAFMFKVAEGAHAARTPTGKKRGLSNLRGGKGVATRTVGLLGAIFSFAIKNGLRADNPVHGVTKLAGKQRERRLSDEEYAALGRGLAAVVQPKPVKPGSKARKADAGMWPPAVAAVRFLALTGWRSGEVIALSRGAADLATRTAKLAETKTGKSSRPLARLACDVLKEATGKMGGGDLVFPASRGDGRMTGFPSLFDRVVKAAGLPSDVTPHVLRHSFASLAADLGYSELTIGALIGHRGASVTSRYVHSADAVLLAAADAVAEETARRMGEARPAATVVELRRAG